MNKLYSLGRHLLLLGCLYSGLSFGAFAQCTNLVVNTNVPLYLGEDCTGTANISQLVSDWYCQGLADIEYYDALGNSIGTTVDGSYLDQTLDVRVHHLWSNQIGWGTVIVTDAKGPWMDCENNVLNCTEDISAGSVAPPAASDNCGEVASMTFSDEVTDLGCGSQGFQEYFDPANWTCVTNAPFSDGALDASGAPDSVILYGASESHNNGISQYIKKFFITIPAEGFVSFDWCTYGPEPNVDAFYITVNNVCIQLSNDTTTCGSYVTPLLQPGDVLSFEQSADGDADAGYTTIGNFHYLTTIQRIVNRTWTATDDRGNSSSCVQVIQLKRATLADVQLPPNRDGTAAPMLGCGADTDPTITGYPFVDEDGDPTTTADQYAIQSGDCSFALTYSDEVIEVCAGQVLTVRNWLITDWCTGQVIDAPQLIKAFDVEAPVFDPVAPITVQAGNTGCETAAFDLPPITATDACTGQVDIRPQWNFGTGYGPYTGVPVGTHTVTYVATDPCGNSSSVSVPLTVVDELAPVMVCDGITSVAVNSDGVAVVPASVVDDGSFDNCCLAALDIKLSSQPASAYADEVTFVCGQTGADVSVDLRGTDCYGNTNVCTVLIDVEDNLPPALDVPADVTLSCGADLTDLAAYGSATLADNCGATLTESVQTDLNNCQVGTITRTWTASDAVGNTANAQQLITVATDQTNAPQIIWPQDYATSGCMAVPQPYELPQAFALPQVSTPGDCAQIGVDFDDQVLYIAEPSCYKVLRTWSVADLCVHQANDTIGLWTHVQLIEVQDVDDPVFTNLPPVVELAATSAAGVTVHLGIPSIDDCSDHIIVAATGDLGAGFGPFLNVLPGQYAVTYTAFDGCGNTSTATQQISVTDDSGPSAGCLNGLSIDLETGGGITIDAALFNLGSSDATTPASELIFSFGSDTTLQTLTFDCTDLGTQAFELWVTDADGHQDFCPSFVNVLDGDGVCGDSLVDVGGGIYTLAGDPLPQTTVALNATSALMTGPDGQYLFSNQAVGDPCTIQPAREFNFTEGVSTYDIVVLRNHVLGVAPITDPYLLLAADANGSGNISSLDGVEMQKVILYINPSFTNQRNWQFIPADYAFQNPMHPLQEMVPDSYAWPALAGDVLDADFIAVKTGDLNGSINVPQLDDPRAAGRGAAVTLPIENRYAEAGEEIEVRIPAATRAVQGTFFVDPDAVTLLEAHTPAATARAGQPDAAHVTALWYAGPGVTPEWLTLRVRIQRAGYVSDWLRLTDRYTPAAAFRGPQALPLQLRFESPPAVVTFAPNPLLTRSRLRVSVTAAGPATLRLFDAAGRVVYQDQRMWKKGAQEWTLERNELPGAGVYHYQLQTPSARWTGRLTAF